MGTHILRTLAAFALVSLAPLTARADERLFLPTFTAEPLHRLGLEVHREPPPWELDLQAGASAAIARGAALDPARPFALFAGLGLGVRRSPSDLVQLRTQMSVPMPFGVHGGTGPMSAWDLEGAHRLRGQVGLGGTEGSDLVKHAFGADVEIEGAFWHAGRYGTAFVRRDIGPFAFRDASARATLWPRLAAEKGIGITLPVSYEIRHVDVDRPEGVFAFDSQRVSSGFGIKPHVSKISHGWFEIVGLGWEKVAFSPPAGVPTPRLRSLEKLDLRAIHLDGMVASPEGDIELSLNTSLGGNWLWDTRSKESLSTFAATWSAAVRGYPDHHLRDKDEDDELAAGIGGTREGGYLADGSALVQKGRFEGFLEASFLGHRTGGSFQGAVERLDRAGEPQKKGNWRGAVAAEWYLGPVKPLQIGVQYASTQLCVSPDTAVGPAWCHRFGVFARIADRWIGEREDKHKKRPKSED
jgi:hypothetical protein